MRICVLIFLACLASHVAADDCVESEGAICNTLGFCEGTSTNVPIPSGTNIVPAGVSKPGSSDGLFSCGCDSGVLGHGYGDNGCSSSGWSVRVVYDGLTDLDSTGINNLLSLLGGISCTRGVTDGCDHVHLTQHTKYPSGDQLGVNVLFAGTDAGKTAAETAAAAFNAQSSLPAQVDPEIGARVYKWTAGTTSDPIQALPAGMEVTNVYFQTTCAQNGCWVIEVDFTVGHSDVQLAGMVKGYNTFYLPYAVGSDALSYDYDYPTSVDNSYEPSKFPCRTSDYTGGNAGTKETLCCFGSAFGSSTSLGGAPATGFLGNYRPTDDFASYASTYGNDANCLTTKPEDVEPNYNTGLGFLDGTFTGLTNTPGVTDVWATDSFVGMYSAVIKVDEKELRTLAGMLKGTVGVEHTVDFFLGYANFKPSTGTVVLDSLATQTNIHVEKTSFFTVSTHGTNDYTFLEYVNMRLVAIYLEDTDFSGAGESGARTVRTNQDNQAHYVQVTFTLGSQYVINENSGLIPLDSVRAGKGTFFDGSDLDHKCLEWNGVSGYSFSDKTTFNSRLGQGCAPAASMCTSPTSIPDSFVSFNIPLGIDFYDPAAQDLSNNVFVDMVISAKDQVAIDAGTTPNDGQDPQQMKTTLTASIPVVEGGINIFCDGYTSKTDLKDVVNVDIVVGSASTPAELTRLRIKEDIASTQLSPDAITQIDSDSIEAGLMTLVIKGNASYFETNSGRDDVTVELEDVVTIHIMQDDGQGENAGVVNTVMNLITAAPDDNSDSTGLDTDGYKLNGAFYFTIDRGAQRAHLEMLPALLAACPFNPPRPAPGSVPLETCVTRRDVRYREYPWRTGAKSTAMEICAGDGSCSTDPTSTESQFFVTIFGDNDYAKQLATDYAGVISGAYNLNGRYRRAYWINPGYEWTPTQTGGTSIFSVSQKLFMFALVTLDEGLTPGNDGKSIPNGPGPSLRRRMLLQQSTADGLKAGQAGAGGEIMEFQTSPRQLMAKAFDVPEDRVATFSVTMQLTEKQACLSNSELQGSLRDLLDDFVESAASSYETVQVTSLSVNKNGVQCRRRSGSRKLLGAFSDATADVTMLVVFSSGTTSTISMAKLKTMPGISEIAELNVSPIIDTTADASYVPPEGNKKGDKKADESGSGDDSSNTTAIIAGVVGGVGGALLIGAIAFLVMRKKTASAVAVPVQAINVHDLKSQLATDV